MPDLPAARTDRRVPTASVRDTLAVLLQVVLPVLARGVIIRRPPVVRLAERLDLDSRAVRRMQRLRDTYGPGPLLLRTPPVRRFAVVLDPADVQRVLHGADEPFAPASREKQASLSHFQPHGVLISTGAARTERRAFNEDVLEPERDVHSLADDLVRKVREEAAELRERMRVARRLDWDAYAAAFHRMVRRVVLGDAARDDHTVTDLLADLRADANWSFMKPKDDETRERFLTALSGHLERAEPGSLASLVESVPAQPGVDRHQQVPQWLFAYDAAAWASFRTLAAVLAHPEQEQRVREELAGRDLDRPQDLAHLRACMLDALRLWPTTPAVLRDTTEDTTWDTGVLPAGTGVLLFAPFFHRDDANLEQAHRFAPELWLDGRDPGDWPLIPFSGGPGECPGRNLVLLTCSVLLASLLEPGDLSLPPGRLDGPQMPGSLDPFTLVFHVGR